MSAEPQYRVDPFKACAQKVTRTGEIAVCDMPRLVAVLREAGDVVQYRLSFSQAGMERYRLTGQVQAELTVTCQRCMGPMRIAVDAQLQLALVQSEQEAELLEEPWEPYTLEGSEVDLKSLLEDELLLQLPSFPRHADATACEGSDWANWQQSEETHEDERETERDNPFAVLQALKKP